MVANKCTRSFALSVVTTIASNIACAQSQEPPATLEQANAPATISPRGNAPLHPIITEILFAVPTDDGTGRGDANNDGTREVAGDEFIEIANPHDQSISLEGYFLRDSAPTGPTRFEFRFPQLTLAPGECAIIFNGRNATWDGPVGDSTRAPEAVHPLYNNAHVFTARCTSRVTFANAGDWIMLVSPEGKRIQCVSWGSPRVRVPSDITTLEDAGRVTGMSIQRDALSGSFAKHVDLDARLYSPGEPFISKPDPEPKLEPELDPDPASVEAPAHPT